MTLTPFSDLKDVAEALRRTANGSHHDAQVREDVKAIADIIDPPPPPAPVTITVPRDMAEAWVRRDDEIGGFTVPRNRVIADALREALDAPERKVVALVDNDGDRWVLTTNGMFSMYGNSMYGDRSRDAVNEAFGPVTEVFG